jgi:hypothetical protein
MTAGERETVDKSFGAGQFRQQRLKETAEAFLLGAGIAAIALLAVWVAVTWLVRATLGVNFGTDSGAAHAIWWTIGTVATVVGVYVATAMYRATAMTGDLARDLAAGTVDEQTHDVTAAMVFQEQEHGGLVYFLRLADERVLVLYDYESQELGADGGEPFDSAMKAAERVTLVRTPEAGFLVRHEFSGAPVEAAAYDLLSDDLWDDGDFCDIPWDELEARLGTAN